MNSGEGERKESCILQKKKVSSSTKKRKKKKEKKSATLGRGKKGGKKEKGSSEGEKKEKVVDRKDGLTLRGALPLNGGQGGRRGDGKVFHVSWRVRYPPIWNKEGGRQSVNKERKYYSATMRGEKKEGKGNTFA